MGRHGRWARASVVVLAALASASVVLAGCGGAGSASQAGAAVDGAGPSDAAARPADVEPEVAPTDPGAVATAPTTVPTAAPTAECSRVVVRDATWDLRQASELPEGTALTAEPTVRWYSELVRQLDHGDGSLRIDTVRISGHDVGADQVLAATPGIELVPIPGSDLLAPAVDDPSVALVVRPIDATTSVMVVGYGPTRDELVDMVESADWVCGAAWLAAGGTPLECPLDSPLCTER